MSKKPNYAEAYAELQQIIADMEHGEITVDELSTKVKRASDLLVICKQKLTQTEGDVNKILAEINGDVKSTEA